MIQLLLRYTCVTSFAVVLIAAAGCRFSGEVGSEDGGAPNDGWAFIDSDRDKPDIRDGRDGRATSDNNTACTPVADEVLCRDFGKDCGDFKTIDNCQAPTIANCGSCTDPDTCGGGGTENVCGSPDCAPESDVTFCSRYGKDCETFTNLDNCGSSLTAFCGTCSSPDTCGGAGTPNVCGCAPENKATFCERLNKECDEFTGADNCGDTRTIYCGSCNYPETCGGSGTNNSCGCTPQSNAEFCQAQNVECDQAFGVDNCGASRLVDNCGSCNPGICEDSACICPGGTVAATLRPGSGTYALHFTDGGRYFWEQAHGYPFESWIDPVSTSSWRCWGSETVVAAFLWPTGSPLSWENASSVIIVTSGGGKFYRVTWSTKSCVSIGRPSGLPSSGMVAAYNNDASHGNGAMVTFLYSNNSYYLYDYSSSELNGPGDMTTTLWPSGGRIVGTYIVPTSTTMPLYVVLDGGAKYKTYDFSEAYDPSNWSSEYNYQEGPSDCLP